jgi:RimJ/RimL family protein N-acetyltransferase
MTSGIPIRILEPSDAEAFRDLRLEALTVAPEAFGASYEEDAALPLETIRARLSASPNVVFGAFTDHALIGMAGFAVYDRVKARHKGLLWGVYVKAEWRGHQVGKRLVQSVIDHASYHVMMLEAAVGLTNDGARRTYHGLGFKPYGIQRKALRVGDMFYDEELLYLDLPRPGDA